jgi:phage tail-like protein
MPRVDPYRNYPFQVEIDGLTLGGFSECTGFGSSVDPTEYREGNEVPTVRKLPGMTKYTNITLKFGLTDSRVLYDWYTDITKGKIERKNGSIVVMDTDGTTEKVRWNFYEGWPTKYDGPDFNAKGTDVAIETFEIAHERLERA